MTTAATLSVAAFFLMMKKECVRSAMKNQAMNGSLCQNRRPTIPNLTDARRKLLTEMIGECWHLFNLPYEITERCGKCGKARSEAYNRTFDTPDDQHAVMQAICKAGKWGEFYWFAWSAWNEREIEDFYGDEGFARWFMDPSRFCNLAGEWAGTLTERWWK